MKTIRLLCVLALTAIHQTLASSVVLHDGSNYLKPGAHSVHLKASVMPHLLVALLGQEASAGHASQQVESVLSSNLVSRPDVIIALQVFGAGDDVTRMTLPAATRVPLQTDAGAAELLKQFASSAKESFKNIEYMALDHSALPNSCGDACQQLIQEAVITQSLNETSQGKAAVGDSLDLSKKPDMIWARELGMLRHAALTAASARASRGRPAGRPQLLEATLVGLQALHAQYGSGSKQVSAAHAMLQNTVEEIWTALHAAHGGKIVLQLSVQEPSSSDSSREIDDVMWGLSTHRAVFQRHLLQTDDVAPEVGASAFTWASSSIAWLMSIILFAAIIAASLCLCNMSFEQDTLLYTSNKTD